MANNMAAGPPPGQQTCVEKITINLNAPPNFEIREKILGSNDQNLNYIRSETKAKISLRGRGSMFYDPTNGGTESNEPLHLYLEHPIFKSLQDAKQLAKNLIETIHADLQVFLQQTNQTSQNPQQQQPPPIMHTNNQQITIPPLITSVPPPNHIIQNNGLQIQQQPVTQQNHFTYTQPHQILSQKPTIMSHNVPMQIIQQTPISIPPPSGIRSQPIVQLQSLQANQQPTNIQIANGQQILVNQAPQQQYQFSYIQTTAPIQQQFEFRSQQSQNTQQIITVQGNTAFMIPPPNIITQQPPQMFQQQPVTQQNHLIDNSIDPKIKSEGKKGEKIEEIQLQTRTILTNMAINQPPPPISQQTIMTMPPPQIFNQIPVSIQQGTMSAPPQQYIVNSTAWQSQQPPPQLQQMHMSSQLQNVQNVQIVAGGMRNPNEIVINGIPNDFRGQQQILTAFNQQQQQPHMSSQLQNVQPQMQQMQFHSIHQPPPTNQGQPIMEQQFQQQQQRPIKRKLEADDSEESGSSHPKTGMGQIKGGDAVGSDHCTTAGETLATAKNRLMNAFNANMKKPNQNLRANVANVNNYNTLNTQNPNMNNNKLNNNKNNNNKSTTITGTSTTNAGKLSKTPAQLPASTVESKNLGKVEVKLDHESSRGVDKKDIKVHNIEGQQNQNNQQQQFMMRGNQNYRFSGPGNFMHHQQPPPGYQQQMQMSSQLQNVQQPPLPPTGNQFQQSNQFNPNRNQMMGNNNNCNNQNMYQHSQQMLQLPPPPQYIQQQHQQQQQNQRPFMQNQDMNSYPNNFNNNPGNMNRFNFSQPPLPPSINNPMNDSGQSGNIMTGGSNGNYQQQQQQQQRFRQW